MSNISAEIEKILNYKTYSKKRKEDALLEMDAFIRTNLGTDSTKKEISQANKDSRRILRAIQKINWELGSSLLYTMDK